MKIDDLELKLFSPESAVTKLSPCAANIFFQLFLKRKINKCSPLFPQSLFAPL